MNYKKLIDLIIDSSQDVGAKAKCRFVVIRNLKQNEAQSAGVESAHKGVN